ncbi:unnamed protein product [Ilex paraguariensis]
MQQKLDKLCEQMNYFKDQPECVTGLSLTKKLELPFREASSDENLSFGCGCQLCEQHKPPSSDSVAISVVKASGGDDMFKYKIPPANEAEPEERRMSDLSDLSPSISSSVDIQLNTLAIEQDIYNLRKECEEKEATIKELSIFVHSSQVVDSKRIVELEDIIRRKNMIITKLRKDMLVLEQKVVNLTRLRRPSFSTASSNERRLPMMADNVLYDMDSTTSPSSSDSDCSPGNCPQTPIMRSQDATVQNNNFASREDQKLGQAKSCTSSVKPNDQHQKSRPVSPLKERSMNQTPDLVNILRPKQSLSTSGNSRSKRRAPARSKDAALPKRWV